MAIDFPSNPTNGMVYGSYIYDSSITAWRNVNTDTGIGTLNAMGLKNVVPTSVAVGSGSATTNANGTVTFSGASTLRLNGIFTGTYRNYRIVYSIGSTSISQSCSLRVASSGTDESGTVYSASAVLTGANTGTASVLNTISGTSWANIVVPYTSQSNSMLIIDMIAPAVSGVGTMGSSYGHNYRPTEQLEHRSGAIGLLNTTAYDGLTIIANSGNITGTVTVYGYTN